jgi:hypothetical protein
VSRLDNFLWWCDFYCNGITVYYSQENRQDGFDNPGSPTYMDCSSMTIVAARQAGYPTGGAWYTGDMVPAFINAGWECLDYSWDAMQPGDVVIRPANASRGGHVVVIGYQGTCYEAYTDEIAPEDQVRQTSIYEFGADYILRPPADDYAPPTVEEITPEPENTQSLTEDPLMFIRVNFGESYGYALVPFGLGATGINQDQADRYYRAGLRPAEVSGEDFQAIVADSWAHYNACFGTIPSKADLDARIQSVINEVKANARHVD